MRELTRSSVVRHSWDSGSRLELKLKLEQAVTRSFTSMNRLVRLYVVVWTMFAMDIWKTAENTEAQRKLLKRAMRLSCGKRARGPGEWRATGGKTRVANREIERAERRAELERAESTVLRIDVKRRWAKQRTEGRRGGRERHREGGGGRREGGRWSVCSE